MRDPARRLAFLVREAELLDDASESVYLGDTPLGIGANSASTSSTFRRINRGPVRYVPMRP